MILYMLDTNMCIYVIKNRPAHVLKKFNKHHGNMCVSAITASELYYGAAKSGVPRHFEDVESFLAHIEVLPVTCLDGEVAGRIRADLAKKGTPIGPYDTLIAGHALANDLTLVTNNTREFERVDGLVLENWILEN